MAIQFKYDVYKITQMKDDCVYKTKQVGEVWLTLPKKRSHTVTEENQIAIEHGGDMLVSTTEWRTV